MTNIFISHSSKDKAIARKISNDLVDSGYTPWLDEWEINVGDCIQTKIDDGLKKCDYLILLLSIDSVNSGWVEKEWRTVYWKEIEEGKTIVLPAFISDCTIPNLLKTKKYADFRKNYTIGMMDVIQSLKVVKNKSAYQSEKNKYHNKVIWHHNVHLHIAQERLCYCIVTFSPIYCKESIYSSLGKLFKENNINSYAIYESTGGIDIILRLWIPAQISNDEFEELLLTNIKNNTKSTIQDFEWFVVDSVITHWIFVNNKINIEEVRALLKSQSIVDKVERENTTGEDYIKFNSRGFVSETERYDGITFLIFVTQPHTHHNISTLSAFKDAIKSIIENQRGINCISFYSGRDGKFRYLIKGCVNYHDYKLINSELISKINSDMIQNFFSVRTFTYTSIDCNVHEKLLLPFEATDSKENENIIQLLEDSESEKFEVKGYMFADIDKWVGKKRDVDLTVGKILEIGAIKSIIGFLNSGIEATIVIGAIEIDKYNDFEKVTKLPVIGKYFILGLAELEYSGRDWDTFQNKLLQAIYSNIDPVPNAWISTRKIEIPCDDKTIRDLCVITIMRQVGLWFYFKNKHDFFVRDGNRTISLSGRQADEYKLAIQSRNRI